MPPGRVSDQSRLTKLARIPLDLHRCEHGRLEGDACLNRDGTSVGNALIPPGATVGHTRYGERITVPRREDRNDPDS